ncbi:MAG: hypothetical protein G3M70_14410 [Candidatus Nitronauta litoralis]|uniref:STAS/SEC14 domain-containing protein n=1 Tax=Candidatus Nitronauta litoralis TaxID=2705533 RepID=A0A7T0G128_9BACT|nr:MAG: hypothetical protein G3M70_14410 [Candidatus Nitronauta litoralis]
MKKYKNNIGVRLESFEGEKVFRIYVVGDAENPDWATLIENTIKNNQDVKHFRFLLDNRFGNDGIDIHGFQMLGQLFRKYKVLDGTVCVLTWDKGFLQLKELFLTVMKKMGLDFKAKVFFDEPQAVQWLVK